MNIGQLQNITQLFHTNPNEAKALLKLLSIDVVKSLGEKQYSVKHDTNTFTLQSDKKLQEGTKYWANINYKSSTIPKIIQLIELPKGINSFQYSSLNFSLKDLEHLLRSKEPMSHFKYHLIEKLIHSHSKEDFNALSNMLLSLQSNVFTIPIILNNHFHLLQLKKRYNKKTEKFSINFYAALKLLGPVSGVISLDEGKISINLNVAFTQTKNILLQDIKNFSYNITISVVENIEALYTSDTNSLLDISI